MRYSDEKNKEILTAVRQEMVSHPNASIFDIQEALAQKFKHTFDKDYVNKLKNKVHGERERFGRIHINESLAEMRDLRDELSARLWETVNSQSASEAGKIKAIQTLWKVSNDFHESLANAGILGKDRNRKPDPFASIF